MLVGLYVSVVWWPASFKAFSYLCLACVNISGVLEIFDSLDSMAWGILSMTVGGWFDRVCTYWCVLIHSYC